MLILDHVEAAARRIGSAVYESPLVHSETLSRLTGNQIYLKLENLQMSGSFKERGALNRILTLTPEEQARGIVAASAGNHGQAVAYHAARRGIPVEIWMPCRTPLIKVTATRSFGAHTVLHGTNYDEACTAAREHAAQRNATFLHAFDDEAVIAGQGTLGLEMVRQNPDLEVIVAPVGGGGLIGGLACAVKSTNPDIEVVGVQTARIPSMREALQKGAPVSLAAAPTLADGIAVREAGALTLPLVHRYVDRLATVEEEEISASILVLLEREKTLAEGAGAAALAALLAGKTSHRGKKIGVLVSGGNLDVTMLARIIEQGLVRDGRRLRLRIRLEDYPGSLERLASIIGKQNANIVETLHNRAHYGVSLRETAVDMTLETRGREHVGEVLSALSQSSYEFTVVE